MSEPDVALYLCTASPSRAQQRAAAAVIVGSLIVFLIAAPFARVQLADEQAFLPAVQSAYIVVMLVATVLLFGQFAMLPSAALLTLLAGYVFATLMAVMHALAFPGLIAPDGMFGNASEGTAWLYFLWHAGYALFVAAYARRAGSRVELIARARAWPLAWVIVGIAVPVLVALTTWVAVSPSAHLPGLMHGNQDGPGKLAVAVATWTIGVFALAVLWRKRPRSLLDLWLMVAVCADLFDTTLAAVLNHARYDAGWYAGRVYGVLAGGAVLVVLLYTNADLYMQLARLRGIERLRAQERLLESEGRFQATFEQAATGIALVSPAGHFLRVNARLCGIVGYTADELFARTFQNITHPPDLEDDLTQLQRLAEGLIARYTLEKRYVHKDGHLVWVNLTASVVRTLHGTPDYFVAVIEDISARKAAEAALNESQERLQLLIDHAPAALAMFDRQMRYLAVSRRWIDDYGLRDRSLIGHCHYDVFPEIGARWKAVHARALRGDVIRSDEDQFERTDGTSQWLRWEVRPWRGADGEIGGIVIFTEDTTHLVEAKRVIVELNADLERRVSERTAELTAANAELDAFAYAVSHDLRAPLRAMNGFAQALREDLGPRLQDETREDLDEIMAASRRMGRLIDGILALSRTSRGELVRERVDISAMATRQLADLVAREPVRRVEWTVDSGLSVEGDVRMLECAMFNLLDNAMKYTARVSRTQIRVDSEIRDGRRWICVRDNGAGFDMAFAQRLFKPFQRLHRQDEFPGIGIGLATAQRIARRHGGEIRACSEPDRGTVFCLYLPDSGPGAA